MPSRSQFNFDFPFISPLFLIFFYLFMFYFAELLGAIMAFRKCMSIYTSLGVMPTVDNMVRDERGVCCLLISKVGVYVHVFFYFNFLKLILT